MVRTEKTEIETEMTDIAGDDNNLQLLRVNHSIKMSEAFESMLSDESLTDISICCSGQVVRAHRLILAASSSYFKQILSGLNSHTQYPIIFVNGIQMQDLKAMLDFMYRGQVTIPQTQLVSLIKSAELLGVSGLSQLDPNAHHMMDNKSRTSSPDGTPGPAKRGRKRKKLSTKIETNDVQSDSDTMAKKTIETGDDNGEDNREEMDELEATTSDKLAKSKLRSWSQQIAFKANHKDSDDWRQSMAVDDSQSTAQTSDESVDRLAAASHSKKEVWRQSRARRPPLKFSEYTLPRGIQEVKTTNEVKVESAKCADPDNDPIEQSLSQTSARPPTPRLTRGRSRVHSTDEQRVVITSDGATETIGTAVPALSLSPTTSTASTTSSSCAVTAINVSTESIVTISTALTPNTRSRRQTHSPSESKSREAEGSVG